MWSPGTYVYAVEAFWVVSHVVHGNVTGRLRVSVCGKGGAWGLHSWGLSVHERGPHLKCPSGL